MEYNFLRDWRQVTDNIMILGDLHEDIDNWFCAIWVKSVFGCYANRLCPKERFHSAVIDGSRRWNYNYSGCSIYLSLALGMLQIDTSRFESKCEII